VKKRVTIIGYYGSYNHGDDMMLAALLGYLSQRPETGNISVFCQDNYYEQRNNVTFLDSSMVGKLGKLLAIMSADTVIWGGGTCFFESADNSGIYWIRKVQRLCRLLGKNFSFLGIGVDPIRAPQLAKVAASLLNDIKIPFFRDSASLANARTIGYRGEARIGGDLAFLWPILVPATGRQRSRVAQISFSGNGNLGAEQAGIYSAMLAELVAEGAHVHFLPAHGGNSDDTRFHRLVAAALPTGCYTLHEYETTLARISGLLATMDFHLGMRLHSVIMADLLGVPNIGIAYMEKVRYYVERSGIMPRERIVALGEPITATMVKGVLAGYVRPEQFITAETDAVRNAVAAFCAEEGL
jgi:polysaccharide pyruvyl transferase WcaK-like protein